MQETISTDSKKGLTREEFEHVYDAYIDKIYSFIYYKTCNRETAEDLTSQTFLNVLQNRHRFDPAKGSIPVWIYRIARNLVIDFYRKKRSSVDIGDVWDIPSTEDVACDYQVKEQVAELKVILSKLPPEQRDIVILRVWQELPYREIARIMGKSEAACKMMFSRVITKLKDALPVMAVLFM
ncbi:MAG: sigma-70 family RNA polymerase sigma factor [Spirochaetales bacterium]|nr:sigma-70 family RNA polymerase sigma factor [Spirochaetales bacterium]